MTNSVEPGEVEVSRAASWPAMILATVGLVALGIYLLGQAPPSPPEPASPPSTTTVPTTTPPSSSIGSVGQGEPLLGEETGLMLVIGSTDTELRTLDLDSGVFTYAGDRLHPHLAEAGWLMARDNWGRWFRLPVASVDLEPEPSAPQRPYIELVHDARPQDGLVWGRSPGFDGAFIWHRLDIATSQVVEVFTAPASSRVPAGPEDILSGPDLVDAEAGGIFRRTPERSFELVHPGRLVAAGEAIALVSVCDDRLECNLEWIGAETAVPMEFPTPDLEPGVGYLIDDDRLLVIENRARVPAVVVVIDTATGRTIRSAGEIAIDDVWLSPNGRWIARRDYGDLRVLDLETGVAVNLPGVRVAQGETVLWAELTEALVTTERPAGPETVSPPVPESHPTHR